MDWVTPGRQTTGLFFGAGFDDSRYRDCNAFVATEIIKDPSCRAEMVVSPRMDSEEMRQEAKRIGFFRHQGLSPVRPYQTNLGPGTDPGCLLQSSIYLRGTGRAVTVKVPTARSMGIGRTDHRPEHQWPNDADAQR